MLIHRTTCRIFEEHAATGTTAQSCSWQSSRFRVLGADAPSKKVNIPRSVVAASRGMDMPGILKQDAARVIAVAT